LKFSKNFSDRFSQQSEILSDRLETLLKNKTPDSIHDVRTSIRRVEAAFQLLPKKTRKRLMSRRYISFCKKLFKSTSPVRDIDIIISNLAEFESLSSVKRVLSTLRSERDRLGKAILEHAKSLNGFKAPKLRKNQLSPSEIIKRKVKVLLELQSRISELVPVILGDFRKIEEIHTLRKYCKRLRYTLEILPSKEEQVFAKLMEQWQKALGNVRDLDVTVEYITENGLGSELMQYLESLKKKRDRALSSFAESARGGVDFTRELIPVAKTVSS